MSELLQVIVDFNIHKLCQQSHAAEVEGEDPALPLQILFDSLIKFLNAFQIQSALNKYRIYLALPKLVASSGPQKQSVSSCHLLFPLDDTGSDLSSL